MPAQVCDVWEATRIAYQSVARRKHATIWGEKTHCGYASRMAERFPDARFIFLWRDLHDVMDSIALAALTERFYRKAGMTKRVLLGIEKLRRTCDTLKAQGTPIHEVYYEEITTNTPECMQHICQFLEIPFERRMTSLEGADRSAIQGGERQHHALVRSDRIVRQAEHDQFVSSALRHKLDRYACRWMRSVDAKWQKYQRQLPESGRPTGLVEIWCDRIIYQSLLCWDEMVKVIYALLPLAFARSLRCWFRQPRDTSDYSRRSNESLEQPVLLETISL
jgi:hypothetical protein